MGPVFTSFPQPTPTYKRIKAPTLTTATSDFQKIQIFWEAHKQRIKTKGFLPAAAHSQQNTEIRGFISALASTQVFLDKGESAHSLGCY